MQLNGHHVLPSDWWRIKETEFVDRRSWKKRSIKIKEEEFFRNSWSRHVQTHHLGIDYRQERTSKALDKKEQTDRWKREQTNERTKEWQEEQTDERMNDIIICINTAGTASQLIQGLPTWRKALGPNLADNHDWFDWFTVFCFFYFPIFSLSSYLAVTQVAPRALCDMGNNCSDVLLLILIV